jgi:hypothetical protein
MLLPRHVVDRLTFVGDVAGIRQREQQIADIEQLARGTNWAAADGKFVFFHLLAVATWTTLPCRSDMPLSFALASLFESVELKNHHVRPLVNCWANWGARSVLAIFTAWNSGAAPQVASVLASDKPVRAARRAAAADHAAARAPRRGQRARLPRPQGSALPGRYKGFVVDHAT